MSLREKLKRRKELMKKFVLIDIGLALILLIIGVAMAFSKVEIESDFSCNTGYIGLDIEANNIIQNKTCTEIYWSDGKYETRPDPENENLTCFKTDLMLDHIKLKDINGLNCKGKANIKMPLGLGLPLGLGSGHAK